MKIECDKCSAKYSIADEKVRGKTFKIRCKKCSNVIIVRDKATGAGLGAEAEAPAAVGWHLAINGETVGPMLEDDVRARFRAGEIDRETAVWQEGFEDWMPLGEVDVFADLAGGASADPFASANQEEYAQAQAQAQAQARAPAVAAAPVARASGGGVAVSEPSSPRVTRLTGQRNENSVLFSLDSLQALATGGGGGGGAANQRAAAAAAPRSGPKGLATVAPSSEGSGLIDIRALGAMVGTDAAPQPVAAAPKADDATLPSFGGASLGGLASTPLVPVVTHAEAAQPVVMAAAPQRSNAPLYVMMTILLIAVVGLGAYIVLRPTEPVIVEKTVQGEAPTVKDAAGKGDEDKDKSKDGDKDKDKDKAKDDEDGKDDGDKAAEDAGEAKDDEAKDDGKADKPDKTKSSGSSGSKSSGSSGSKSSGSSGSSGSKPSSGSTTPSKPTSSGSNDLPVECILDPNSPKCKGAGKSSGSKPSSGPAAPSDPNLPDMLSSTDIKAGVSPVKDAAKACGSKHGAQPGEKVKIKLSIAGATGAVTSAAAEPPHQGTPLGNCVAAALKKATFKKFKKASLGAVYPVTM